MNVEILRVFHPYTKWEDHHFGMYQNFAFMDEPSLIKDGNYPLTTSTSSIL